MSPFIDTTVRFDTYTLRARILPVLLVALPGVLAAIAWFPETEAWWSTASTLLVGAGVPALLAEFGRDWGKKKEPRLYAAWGGKPTTRLLRHRDAPNKITLAHQHRKLQELLGDIQMPTAEEEAADPDAADMAYDAAVAVMRERTRDQRLFPLVYKENVSYGFRRNLWGMKPLGMVVALLGLAAVGALVILLYVSNRSLAAEVAVAALGDLLFLGAWLFWITPAWVRVPAEAYAEQLLTSSAQL